MGVSLALARLGAKAEGTPLFRYLKKADHYRMPLPMMNIINGGAHANNGMDIQEFMIVPHGAPTFREALRMGAEIFQALKKNLAQKGCMTTVGDEGGFAPALTSNQAALDFIMLASSRPAINRGAMLV